MIIKKENMVALTDQEADVYYNSDWYKNIMKTKREKLISSGAIKNPVWHENTTTYPKFRPRLIKGVSRTEKPL